MKQFLYAKLTANESEMFVKYFFVWVTDCVLYFFVNK